MRPQDQEQLNMFLQPSVSNCSILDFRHHPKSMPATQSQGTGHLEMGVVGPDPYSLHGISWRVHLSTRETLPRSPCMTMCSSLWAAKAGMQDRAGEGGWDWKTFRHIRATSEMLGLGSSLRPECRAPASIPDVGSQTGGYIWFASGLFS